MGTDLRGVESMLKPMRVRALGLFVVLGLLLTLGACRGSSPESEEPDGGSATPPQTEQTEPAGFDLNLLTGSWAVSTELTSIDNAAMTPAADKPGGTWVCAVNGSEVTLVFDDVTYEGTAVADGVAGWVFDGTAEYVDDEGRTWTSTIRVSSAMVNDDAFTGIMDATIESDTDGHLYTADYSIVGNRQ